MPGRVIVFGNNTIAVNCIRYLAEQDVEILGVVAEPSDTGEDGWQKSVRKGVKELGLPLLDGVDLGCKEFLERIRGLSPDFIFSIQCARILGGDLIDIPKHGAINLHYSRLPKYRGCYPIAWSIINGEKSTGVTLHFMDEGIDTGNIISQVKIDIGENETGRRLFDKCTRAGLDLFIGEAEKILKLENATVPQDDRLALYYPSDSIVFSNNRIDWSMWFVTLYDWIRAFIFPPFQYPCTTFNGKTIEIASVFSYNNIGIGEAGEITDIDERGVSISAGGGNIVVNQFSMEGEIKGAAALVQEYGVNKGDMLG